MSEINIENLLKRAKMLEDEKDYSEALAIYNRILENEPDNNIAFERRRAIMNNTLTIVREQIPQLVPLGAHYIIYVDGVKVDDSNFVCNTGGKTHSVPVMLGKHRLSVNQVTFTGNLASEREVVNYTFDMEERETVIYLRYTKTGLLHFSPLAQETATKSGGCYVATAVYGSYDCPEVWTLRRFRDNTLAETLCGRAFISVYYAISPTLVKWFGNTEWFRKLWKPSLDKMVKKLNSQGVENTSYNDREW